MNRTGAYFRLFALPYVGGLARRIGRTMRVEGTPRQLSDHLLKDIGISHSEMLSLRQSKGHPRARR